jgi:protein SCO1/2
MNGRASAIAVLCGVATFLAPPARAFHPPNHMAPAAADAAQQAAEREVAGRLLRDAAAPPFVLTDQDGRRLALADLRGKVVVVGFIHSTCPGPCLLLNGKFAFLQRRFAEELGRRVVLLSITTDPLTDTPQTLKAYGARFRADAAGWRFLTGALDEITDVLRRYRLLASDVLEGFDPPVVTYLIDSAGMIAAAYVGSEVELRTLVDAIQVRLDGQHAAGAVGGK